jgi:hypothetical protein
VDGLIDGRAGALLDVFVGERDEGDAQVDGVLERLAPARARSLGTPRIRGGGSGDDTTPVTRRASQSRGRL